jgi:hypothetical protein
MRCFSSGGALRHDYEFIVRSHPLPGEGLPHSEIVGSQFGLQLPDAFRSYPRPSSALDAKASTACLVFLLPRSPIMTISLSTDGRPTWISIPVPPLGAVLPALPRSGSLHDLGPTTICSSHTAASPQIGTRLVVSSTVKVQRPTLGSESWCRRRAHQIGTPPSRLHNVSRRGPPLQGVTNPSPLSNLLHGAV